MVVEQFAKLHNITTGVCDAAPIDAGRLASPFVPFVTEDLRKRTVPEMILPKAGSIVVIGVPYPETKIKEPCAGSAQGVLSSLALHEDYHIRVKSLLRKLADEMKLWYGSFRYKILADSPTLEERILAYRAGIGFFGRNGLIISQKFGSRFNIGCMLTDIPKISFINETTLPECPPNCRKCTDACPTNALCGEYLDARKCISYLTQKDILSPEEESLMGKHLYGCDICMDACPFNSPQPVIYANPEEWINMSDEDFKREYGKTAMMWRGADILRRNARVVLSNI